MRYINHLTMLMFLFTASSAVAAMCDIPTTGRFAVDANGDITDSNTGLTWKRCLEGQNFSGGNCTGTATAYAWQGALGLTANGWRVPNIKELQSIVDETKSILTDTTNYPDGPLNPAINTDCFPTPVNTDVFVWSASPYVGSVPAFCTGNVCAWLINFKTGVFYEYPQSTAGTVNVRLVKDPQ